MALGPSPLGLAGALGRGQVLGADMLGAETRVPLIGLVLPVHEHLPCRNRCFLDRLPASRAPSQRAGCNVTVRGPVSSSSTVSWGERPPALNQLALPLACGRMLWVREGQLGMEEILQ